MQQGVAIEQQLREDIEKLTREGFVAIRSVALANDMQGEYLLIDDSLPPEAIIRCDQLMFFTDGFATPMLNTISTSFAGQGLATRLYYGHGVKFPELSGMGQDDNGLEESCDPVYFDTDDDDDDGLTTIVVTHDGEIGNRCQRVIHLKDGLIDKDCFNE